MFKAKVMDAPALGSPESEKEKIGCWPFKRLLSLSPQPSPQEIYFESRGKCCKKLLRYNGYTNKVLLYPEEGWARNATSSYLMIKLCRWWSNLCIVEEIAGARYKESTYGRIISIAPGAMLIIGSFKQVCDADFKLYLTSNISMSDYNMGYCLTGTLEKGSKKANSFQQTHFAVVRRRWPSTKDNKTS